MKKFLFFLLGAGLFSCSQNVSETISPEMESQILAMGDNISSDAQGTLMQNVSQAIQTGGTEYAVDFCNLNAIPLTDTVAAVYDMTIQRLTDKPRNPDNAIQSETDKEAWEKIKAEKAHFVMQDKDGNTFYYKPIMIGMPTCLSCHGNKTEIAANTLQILEEKYPNGQATGYQSGDLRGMWKLKMNTYEQLLRSQQQ